jgi:tetratricopeptide (TPR) repeat protein
MKRFPKERRFMLGQGIARDRVWADDATQAYRAVESDVDVGGEALMRFGAMQMRLRRPAEALELFERALDVTRDPYVIFLAHYFSGQIYERQPDLKRAEASYRRAAGAVPHAQSATLALATLLARDERRAEAQRLVADMVGAAARPTDPWRRFVHADDRFWPLLIGRLRAEIAR